MAVGHHGVGLGVRGEVGGVDGITVVNQTAVGHVAGVENVIGIHQE